VADPTWVDVCTLVVAAGGFVVAVGGFGLGIYQYRQGRLEARRKFAAESIRVLKDNLCVQAAGRMLDWSYREGGIEIPVPGTDKRYSISPFVHTILAPALVPHQKKQDIFPPDETAIRDVFDVFIDELEILAHQEAAKAIALEDIAPYLRYLADLVHGRRDQVDKKVSVNLIEYMERYWGLHILDFLDRCRDYKPPPGPLVRLRRAVFGT